jgi:hypothetical protein
MIGIGSHSKLVGIALIFAKSLSRGKPMNVSMSELVQLIEECIGILSKNRGSTYVGALEAVLETLADESLSERERILKTERVFLAMGHRDGLFDFYIDGPTVQDRIKSNERLNFVRSELRRLLCI